MDECTHLMTRNDKCVECGEVVFSTETRPCSECKKYKLVLGGPICKKHLMAVTPDMHAYYKIKNGTCFE
jgi:hypothetical protein